MTLVTMLVVVLVIAVLTWVALRLTRKRATGGVMLQSAYPNEPPQVLYDSYDTIVPPVPSSRHKKVVKVGRHKPSKR